MIALPHDVAQVRTMKAGDVLVRIAKLELLDDVVAYALGGAGGKGGDGNLGKIFAQQAQLAVLGTEFVSPLGDAVRLIDREQRQRHGA